MVKVVMHNIDYSPEMPSLDIIDEYFDGDWRRGKEIQRVTITQRLYQISIDETKAWFLNELKGNCNVSDWSAVVGKTLKSKQTFIRIQIDSDNPENFLKHYYASMSTKITILNGYDGETCLGLNCQPMFLNQMNQVDEFIPGYKKFKNMTIQTQVRFKYKLNYIK